MHIICTSTQMQPAATLLACCGHKIFLWENMSYAGVCLTGAHVSREDMSFRWTSFRMTCLTGVLVLWEVMLCRKTCLMGGHAVHECMSSGWHMLQEDVSYWETRHTGQVLLEGTSYRSQEDMFLQVYIFFMGWLIF